MRDMRGKCYECKHSRPIEGDCHIKCANKDATVTGHHIGKENGWFLWPVNFDPSWLVHCDGFKEVDGE